MIMRTWSIYDTYNYEVCHDIRNDKYYIRIDDEIIEIERNKNKNYEN